MVFRNDLMSVTKVRSFEAFREGDVKNRVVIELIALRNKLASLINL